MKYLVLFFSLTACSEPPTKESLEKKTPVLIAGCSLSKKSVCDSIVKEFCKTSKVISDESDKSLSRRQLTVECTYIERQSEGFK